MRSEALRLWALAALLAGLAASAARGEVIERILAAVDGRPVTLSEVTQLAALRGLDRRAALEAAIDERLMFQEAVRLPQAAVTAEEEERAYRSLVQRAPAPAAAESALRALARRETAILKYVEFRFRPQLRVGDEAVRAAYAAEYAGLEGAPPLESVAGAIRERLEREELDAKLEAWVKELRDAAEIRYNP